MFFKIILFLTILCLHNICTHGKICKIEIPAKQSNANRIASELFLGSTAEVKIRPKRDIQESGPSINGIARVQTLRNYLNIIEQYISAIRKSIDNEKNLLHYQPLGQHVQSIDNDSSEIFNREFSETKVDPKMETLKYQGPLNSHLQIANGGRNNIINNADGRDNETIFPGFNQVQKPEMTFEPDSDDLVESNGNFKTYENTDYDDYSTDFIPNVMQQDITESIQNYIKDDIQNINNQGMSNPCEECRKCFHPFKNHSTMHIKNDCSSRPKIRFMNECCFQSRAHCRPYKLSFSSHQLPKYHPFNYKEMHGHCSQ